MLFAVYVFIIAAVSGVLSDQLEIQLTDHWRNVTDSRFCSAETANFGSAYLFWSMQGIMVNAFPMNACKPVQPPPYQRNDSLAWIALVARDKTAASGCPFDQKVLNAQLAGFDAVLVQNYENTLLTMQPSGSGNRVHIPVAMVTLSCGAVLRDRLSYSVAKNRYSLSFEIPFPFDFHVYVISFAIIIGVCLLLSLLVWGIKFYRDWRRSRRNRLPRSSLKKLTVKKFEKGKDLYDCCAICLEDYVPGEKLRILPCNHAYHTKCVDPWLLKSRSTCPVCKRRVFPGSGESEGEDDEQNQAAAANASPADSPGPSSSAAAAPDSPVDLDADSPPTRRQQHHRGRQQHGELPQPPPSPSQTSSASLLLAMQDEQTPLLHQREESPTDEAQRQAAISASSADNVGTFDNAALDADCPETDDNAGAAGSVSVRVFVHGSPRSGDEGQREPAV